MADSDRLGSTQALSNPTAGRLLLTALSLSIGWGIRGNYGHEYGAMIAGALAAMALVLMAGRADWDRRIAYFGLFGALGWSFGGSISYMLVIAYTHSGDAPSVLYGFVNLFVIGFLWAAPGGAGTAFPAFTDRDRLTELFAPMSAVFLAWWLQGLLIAPWLLANGFNLNWHDTDWLAALLAILAVGLLAIARRTLDRGSLLILYMATGWWLGFLILVVGLGLRMTPPRGDNWAGILGLTIGMLIYCVRQGLQQMARASLITGFIGGIGFAGAAMLQLIEIKSGYSTNWHSILEQSIGLFNGIGVAVAMALAVRTAPVLDERGRGRRWTDVYACFFVLIVITYLNLRKNIGDWNKTLVVPIAMHDIPAWIWFDLIYAAIALAVLVPLVRHLDRPLPALKMGWEVRGTWLYLIFLWWMVIGNFAKALAGFHTERLVTEGVITLNAAFCTGFVLLALPPRRSETDRDPIAMPPVPFLRLLAIGFFATAITTGLEWSVVRAIHGNHHSGKAKLQIRFGPNANHLQVKP